jgi:hypothetical protein
MGAIGLPVVALRREEQNRTGGVGRQTVEWTDILRCPETGNRLQFDEPAALLRVEHSDETYTLIDGIIDFCPQAHDRVAASYDRAAPRYDSYMTAATIPMKIKGRIIWGFASDRDPVGRALALLPDHFDGVLLDVPVGTGVFTASLYRRYPWATILGVDVALTCCKAQAVSGRRLTISTFSKPMRPTCPFETPPWTWWSRSAAGMPLPINSVPPRRSAFCGGAADRLRLIRGAPPTLRWFVRRFGVRSGFFTRRSSPARYGPAVRRLHVMQQGGDKSFAWLEAVKEA